MIHRLVNLKASLDEQGDYGGSFGGTTKNKTTSYGTLLQLAERARLERVKFVFESQMCHHFRSRDVL